MEFIEKLETTLKKIFISYNPFEPVFQNGVKKKTVLYPTEGFHLTKQQFAALVKAIKDSNENSFYIAVVEVVWNAHSLETFELYNITPREPSCNISYEDYCSIPFPLENALFSTKGTWGVIVSHEDHAVIGGTDEFMEAFEKNYSAHQQEFKDFIDYYIDLKQTDLGGNYSWLIPFLDYMNPDWRDLDPNWRDVK